MRNLRAILHGPGLRALGAAIALSGLAGCGSISERLAETAADTPGIGLPANAPERPTTPVAFPHVHDMPPARPAALLNEAEQKRVEAELIAARSRHRAVAEPPADPAPAQRPAGTARN